MLSTILVDLALHGVDFFDAFLHPRHELRDGREFLKISFYFWLNQVSPTSLNFAIISCCSLVTVSVTFGRCFCMSGVELERAFACFDFFRGGAMFKSVGLLLNSTGISGVNPLEPEILLEAASSIFTALLTEGPGVDSFSSELSSVSMVGSAKVVSFGGGSLLQIWVSRQKGVFYLWFRSHGFYWSDWKVHLLLDFFRRHHDSRCSRGNRHVWQILFSWRSSLFRAEKVIRK